MCTHDSLGVLRGLVCNEQKQKTKFFNHRAQRLQVTTEYVHSEPNDLTRLNTLIKNEISSNNSNQRTLEYHKTSLLLQNDIPTTVKSSPLQNEYLNCKYFK